MYMAPEILYYQKYDINSDLWSVGIILYEMVVGKPPFNCKNIYELVRCIENKNIVIDDKYNLRSMGNPIFPTNYFCPIHNKPDKYRTIRKL